MSKGQAISIDLLLAILVFVSLIVGFFYVVSIFSERDDTDRLKGKGEDMTRSLQTNNSRYGFIKGNQIEVDKLTVFSDQTYQELQNSLGLTNDFCIYLEDEAGNIIPIDGKAGIGSNKVKLGSGGQYNCSETIT